MKASTLLTTLKSKITSTECQTDMLTKKYGEFKEKYMDDAADLLENYGSILAAPIIQVMTDSEKKKLGETIIAVLPLNSVNARTYKADDNEYLIALNERLLALIYAWGELQFLPLFCPDEVPENFASLFAPIIDCYLTPNSVNALPIFNFDKIPRPATELLTLKAFYAEQFITAHELAHIVLGHMDEAEGSAFHEDAYEFSSAAYNPKQQLEFDADIQACKWMQALFPPSTSYSQLFLCIEVFVLFHYIECNLSFPRKNTSHPAALSRLINIQEHFPHIKGIADMVENCRDIDSFRVISG